MDGPNGSGVDTPDVISAQCSAHVNVKKFKQARVNGGSNYDSLKVRCNSQMPRHLISDARINEIPSVPIIYYLAKPPQQPRERAWKH